MRYLNWLWNILHGNLGTSVTGRSVADQIGAWALTTLELQLLALFFAVAIGIPVGVLSAKRQYSKVDYAVTTIAVFGYSMPTFWLGIMLIIVFSFVLGWLPSSGVVGVSYLWWGSPIMDHIAHLILPVFVLTYVELATFVRLIRSNMLEVLRQDYILAARSSGLSESTVTYRYALRNAITPVVTIVALTFGGALGGAPATETAFSWPGLGLAFTRAALVLDIPLVQGITIVITLMVLLANIALDLTYGLLDPRVRIE
jgi:ABC-type dipeptide/oligopeptide/nickel transport system permease component